MNPEYTSHPAQPGLDALVNAGQLAGAAAFVWRDGKLSATPVSGWRDLETQAPMRRDTLFRMPP